MRSKLILMKRGFFLLLSVLAIFAILALIRHETNGLISKSTSEVENSNRAKKAAAATHNV